MKGFDRYLQKKRIEQAIAFIRTGSRVLDIGCDDGLLFEFLGSSLKRGVGIDPALHNRIIADKYELIPGIFPADLKVSEKFDVVTILAVIEHFSKHVLESLNHSCCELLDEKGLVVITVPSAPVDSILKALLFFRIIDGMATEEHHGFKPDDTLCYFLKNFKLIKRKTFQFGLNNLFVFEKKH
jgi:2-polyprenyl-3-methyl-5-hydroxy-6-metoxy-1,4-benzoquinol methylase